MKSNDVKIKEWLSEQLQIPDENIFTEKCITNKYSQSMIFSQTLRGNEPFYIFVKSINSGDDEADTRHYNNEIKSYRLLENGPYENVCSPELFSENSELRCLAMNYIIGNSLFNQFWNSRRRSLFLCPVDNKNMEIVSGIGRWLSKLHSLNTRNVFISRCTKEIISHDHGEISKRYFFLQEKNIPFFDKRKLKIAYGKSVRLSEELKQKEFPLGMIHGDFSLANIIVNKQGVAVVDYSMAQMSVKEDDLARMICDLINIEISLKCADYDNSSIIKKFLDGYGYVLTSENRKILEFYLIKHLFTNITMHVSQMQSGFDFLSFGLFLNSQRLLSKMCS